MPEFKQLFEDYHTVFGGAVGKRVLADLSAQFADELSYTSGDPHQTAFNEGARSVVLYIRQNLLYHKRPSLYSGGELDEE